MKKPNGYFLLSKAIVTMKKAAVRELNEAVTTCRIAGYSIQVPSESMENEFAENQLRTMFSQVRSAMEDYEMNGQ